MTSEPKKRQNRRGFELIFLSSFLLAARSLYLLLTGNLVWGILEIQVAAIIYYVVDQATKPSSNDVYTFCRQTKTNVRPPVLVCLGDSITHGRSSSNWVDRILSSLCDRIGRDVPAESWSPESPLWVVNCGQNNVVSEVCRYERVDWTLACKPNYVVVLIGTNDCRGLLERGWKNQLEFMWWTKRKLSFEALQENIDKTVQKLLKHCETLKLALCTLPPMSEDLNNDSNKIIRHANKLIVEIAEKHNDRCRLLDIYSVLASKIQQSRSMKLPVGMITIFAPAFSFCQFVLGYSLNGMASYIGNVVLSDCLHLNDVGGDLVRDLVVDFIMENENFDELKSKKE